MQVIFIIGTSSGNIGTNTVKPVTRGHSKSVPTWQVSPYRRYTSMLKYNLAHRKCNLDIPTGVSYSQVLL